MKTLIALITTASLPFAAQAQRGAAVADTISRSTCSISSEGGVSSLDWSWGASNSGSSSIVGEVLRVTTTPSSDGGTPTVTAHAINTKGAGANDRLSASAGLTSPKQTQGATFGERVIGAPTSCAHAINTKGTGAQSGRLPLTDAGKAPRDLACRINPGSSVTIFNPPPPSTSDKVSMQDFHFVSSSSSRDRMSGGPGGGPHVQAIVCSGADGAPSSVSMLLLPAVQK